MYVRMRFRECHPKTKVAFNIELVPGTGLIAKSPYRVAPAERQELNKQLDELVEKGYARPSVSPWVSLFYFIC